MQKNILSNIKKVIKKERVTFTARRGKQISAIDLIYVQLELIDEISIELSGKRVSNKYFPKRAGAGAIPTTRLIIASRCAPRLFRHQNNNRERERERRERARRIPAAFTLPGT